MMNWQRPDLRNPPRQWGVKPPTATGNYPRGIGDLTRSLWRRQPTTPTPGWSAGFIPGVPSPITPRPTPSRPTITPIPGIRPIPGVPSPSYQGHPSRYDILMQTLQQRPELAQAFHLRPTPIIPTTGVPAQTTPMFPTLPTSGTPMIPPYTPQTSQMQQWTNLLPQLQSYIQPLQQMMNLLTQLQPIFSQFPQLLQMLGGGRYGI